MEALFEALRRRWLPEGYPDEAAEARWYSKAERTLARFHGEESSRRTKLIGVEKEFAWSLGNHSVRGMIDRIDQGPDGAYELIDYKTGPEAPRRSRWRRTSSSASTPWAPAAAWASARRR